MRNEVGPTAEYLNNSLAYGDLVKVSPSRNLSPDQFPKAYKVAQPTDDNGWIGPLGSFGEHPSAGSLYGYGVPSDNPQY